MNSYLKLIPGIVGLATLARALLAADAAPYQTYPSSAPAPPAYSASNSIATSSSNAVVLALNAQALLLKELAQEHQKRAADLTQRKEAEKAKWEADLVDELQQKGVRVQKGIDQAIRPSQGTNDLKTAAASDVDDRLVFESTAEARLEQIRQQLSAASEDSHALSMQIVTNNAPEDFARLSSALSDNQKAVEELQREQLDLELRQLEFRALWKAIQK